VNRPGGTYGRYSDEERAQIGDYAVTHGVTTAIKHYAGTKRISWAERDYCGWKEIYNKSRKETLPNKQ